MNTMLKDISMVVARWALTALGVWLVHQHFITSDQQEPFVIAAVHDVTLALPAVGGLVLGICAKIRSRRKFLTALTMEPGATENDVKDKLKSGDPTPTVFTPPNTTPGVPKGDG